MSRDEIAHLVRRALTSVAPESTDQPIEPEADFRDQMDLDSMDAPTDCFAESEGSWLKTVSIDPLVLEECLEIFDDCTCN